MKTIFFSGIGGSGISAIACFLIDRNFNVRGSDRAFDLKPSHPVRDMLVWKGASLFPQDGSGLDADVDLLVFSAAVESNHPEIVKARQLGIQTMSRPEYLAYLASSYNTIAVAGTNGKSTTAGMLAYLMKELDMKPNYLGGGVVVQFQTSINLGNSLAGASELMVFEACESDGTVANYRPAYSIINNLTLDHHSVEDTARMFHALAKNTQKLTIVCGDDENLNRFGFNQHKRFSIDTDSEYKAEKVVYDDFKTRFQLHGVDFELSQPGKHNLYNALACISLLAEIGTPLTLMVEPLRTFSGIKRRFQIHLNENDRLVVDDYAHNPQKIASLIDTINHIKQKVCYVFQPHGYGPTRFMRDDYVKTFVKLLRTQDHLFILPIFYQGGTTTKDISSEDLVNAVKQGGKSAEAVHERETILNRLDEWKSYVVFGARDETLSAFAEQIAYQLRALHNEDFY
jgi:UDP-N-acetylmuramate--alanine ligase